MNLARFDGYPVTLQTALSVEACYQRLRHEFYSPTGYWQHATTDKQLLGWYEGVDFVICPTWRFDPMGHTPRYMGGRGWDTSRIVQLRIRQHDGLTIVSGRYGYADGAEIQVALLLCLPLGIIFGLLMLIAGLLLSFQNRGTLWLGAFGATVLGLCIFLISDSSDGGFPRERDYIVRYLARVLEAQPASGVEKVRGMRKNLTDRAAPRRQRTPRS